MSKIILGTLPDTMAPIEEGLWIKFNGERASSRYTLPTYPGWVWWPPGTQLNAGVVEVTTSAVAWAVEQAQQRTAGRGLAPMADMLNAAGMPANWVAEESEGWSPQTLAYPADRATDPRGGIVVVSDGKWFWRCDKQSPWIAGKPWEVALS